MKTYAEHIASLEATRAEKIGRMKELHQGVADENRTLNAAEQEEYDTVEGEVRRIDADLARTKKLEELDRQTAKPVDATTKANATVEPTRLARGEFNLKTIEKLEPGIAAARYTMCLIHAKGDHQKAFRLAERHYPQTEAIVKTLKAQADGANLAEIMRLKTAIPAGTTTETTWAAPLVYASVWQGDFINYLRPRTLIGQAQFRPVPFNVRVNSQTSGGTGYWVGQGKAKPVTKFDFSNESSSYTKVAAISVITQELARLSDPSAEMLVRDSLADAVIARVDSDLFDPDVAAVANVNPAGLLNGVAAVAAPTTNDPDGIRCAILGLWAAWDSTNLGARPAYYTTPTVARYLASLRDSLGNRAFPGVTNTGGELDGVALRTSNYLANNGGSSGAPFILVDESEIYLADDGSVTVDASDVASVEMSNAPSGDSGTPTDVQLTSMWQTNSIAIRAERYIWWGKRRSGAVQWIDGFPSSCS